MVEDNVSHIRYWWRFPFSVMLIFSPSIMKLMKILIWERSVGLDRCWWRMLETKCVGDNFQMLVTVLVTNILYLLTLASGTNIQRCHQDLNSVPNILKLTLTVSHNHHNVTNMTVASFTNDWSSSGFLSLTKLPCGMFITVVVVAQL